MDSNNSPIDSLLTLCIECLMTKIEYNLETFKLLPFSVKNLILRKSFERIRSISCSKDLYKALLHPKVESLDLSTIEVDDELLEVVHVCRQLKKLVLCRKSNIKVEFSAKGVEKLIPSLTHLNTLVLSGCSVLNDNIVQLIVKYCPCLNIIDFSSCRKITDLSLNELSHLKELYCVNVSDTLVTSKGIIKLVKGNSGGKLKELYMANCTLVTDEALHAICKYCLQISILIFNNCEQIDGKPQLKYC